MPGSLTEHIKAAVTAELDRQRTGLDGLHGVRTVSISVRLTPWPTRASRAVTVDVEMETRPSVEKKLDSGRGGNIGLSPA